MVLTVRVIPRSSRTGFDSIMDNGIYKIRLKAPPVEGKANIELFRWLSREFSTSRGCIALISGSSSRTKTVEIREASAKPDWYNG